MDIGAAIRQQMLSVLIEAIGRPGGAPPVEAASGVNPLSPTAPLGARSNPSTPNGQPALPPDIRPGAQVAARVLEWTPAGEAVLAVGGRMVTAKIAGHDLPPAAHRPGATILLRVETTGETPRFSFVGMEAAPAGRTQGGEATAAPALPRAQPNGPSPNATLASTAATALRPAATALPDRPDALAPSAHLSKPEIATLPALVQAAAANSAAKQGSAAPLFAELAALVERPDAPLPAAAVTTAKALLQTRLDGEEPVTPQALKEAIQRAAVPSEALAARGETEIPDVKTLVGALRGLLALAEHRPAAAPEPDAEPPHRDGAPHAIRPAAPQLAGEHDPHTVATVIAREADQAIERSRLHQIASLPDMRPAEQARQHLSFDLPLALGPQTAIAGFRIEREKRPSKGPAGGAVDSWGVRFAIDADGLGPVQAHLRLTGSAISVSLWAEDSATRQRFIEALPSLEAALAENALEVGEVTILGGRPVDPKPPAGLFLDRAS